MLTDIFSSFDPATVSMYNSLPSPIFWSMNLILISTFFSTFWIAPSSFAILLSYPKEMMHSQVSRTFGKHLKGFSPLLTGIFLFLLLANLAGLFPYVFSLTSHLYLTLTLALPLWLSLIMSSASNSITGFLAALLPGGAPGWLNPFLTLAETLSTVVRPFTLSFRLAANMSAGHVVLCLIGIYAASACLFTASNFIFLIFFQAFYILFELGISLIQAYIFCLLLSLYADDHTS